MNRIRKYVWLAGLCCAFSGIVQAQEYDFCRDFEELTDTKPIDESKWMLCKRPYYSAWGSTDVRYSKTNVPDVDVKNRTWKGKVWRG
ncbi:MAG: hypothetical protein K2I90_12250, partial [Odoribacter sp.]|nr:hypothetical protein [Odoribacter sp.]